MKKLVYVLFTMLLLGTVGCSKIDYEISVAYEQANITGITIYAVTDNPVNIVESFEIDTGNAIVRAFVPEGTDLTHLRLVLTLSSGATVSPALGGFQDLSSPLEFTVTSPNGIKQIAWQVIVAATPSAESSI